MEKMRMESSDMVSENIKKLQTLFPNCISETADDKGRLIKSVNFEMLQQMLSSEKMGGGV